MRVYPREIVNLSANDVLYAFSSLFASKLDGGGDVRTFELQFSERMRCKEAVAVSSARLGLALILQGFGLKPGDEVILPSYTFREVPNSLVAMRLKPVFVDVCETDFTIDPGLVEPRITERTRALIPTHLSGQPADMKAIGKIAEQHSLLAIEDCAQAAGAEFRGTPVGSIGDAGIFSFSMGKDLQGFGGGMIATKYAELADAVRASSAAFGSYSRWSVLKSILISTQLGLSSHPTLFRYTAYPVVYLSRLFGKDAVEIILSGTRGRQKLLHDIPMNMRKRFLDLNAKILMKQLSSLDAMHKKRSVVAGVFNRILEEIEGIHIPQLSNHNKNTYWEYAVRVPACDRQQLQRFLIKRGIDTKKPDMSVCSDLGIFREFSTDCPVARTLYNELLYLPINHHMGPEDAMYIAKAFRDALKWQRER